jgi:hypothetical protein
VAVPDDETRCQNHLTVEIELLDRQIAIWVEKGFASHPKVRRAVERKQLLQRELETSKLRQRLRYSPRDQVESVRRVEKIGFAPGEEVRPNVRDFTHQEDYRSVTLRGQTYTLTSRQAQVVEILHRAYLDEKPDVAIDYILEKLGTQNSRWQDTFKRNPEARKALIRKGERKGTLRLNL